MATIVKILKTGAIDTTWGFNGVWVSTSVTALASTDNLFDLGVSADGMVSLLLSKRIDSFDTDISLIRLNAQGQLVTSFGNQGQFQYGIGTGRMSLSRLIHDSAGRLLIAGTYSPDNLSFTSYPYVLRLTANGTADSSFGTNGLLALADQVGSQTLAGLTLAGNAPRLVTYETDYNLQIVRNRLFGVSSTGVLESSFGTNGVKLVDHFPEALVNAAHGLPNGDIVFVQSRQFGELQNKVGSLVRVKANGADDPSLGNDVASWEFTGLQDGRYAVQVSWSGVAATSTNAVYQVSTDRFNNLPNGASSAPVNQTQPLAATNSTSYWGGTYWQELRSATDNSKPLIIEVIDGVVRVYLSAGSAIGSVVADAVRLVPVTADAFAWDGTAIRSTPTAPTTLNGSLSTFVGTGDINADGKPDFVFSDNYNAYVFFGPVDPRSQFRVDTEDLNGDQINDLRVRGQDWTYDTTFQSNTDLAQEKNYYRITGRADVIFPTGAGSLAIGNFDGTPGADLAALVAPANATATTTVKIYSAV